MCAGRWARRPLSRLPGKGERQAPGSWGLAGGGVGGPGRGRRGMNGALEGAGAERKAGERTATFKTCPRVSDGRRRAGCAARGRRTRPPSPPHLGCALPSPSRCGEKKHPFVNGEIVGSAPRGCSVCKAQAFKKRNPREGEVF